jgi:arsenate reductase
MILYGIANCDTVKKARQWLKDGGFDYTFHDVRKDGLSLTQLNYFVANVDDWQVLVNRKSATMRTLTPEQIARSNTLENALALLIEKPTILKRPILDLGNALIVGFDVGIYQKMLQL